MEVIESIMDYSSIGYKFDIEENICFIDIETTGLSRKWHVVYLIGILYFDRENKNWTLRQYFANDLSEETQVLAEASRFISSFDKIYNYNGNSFDIPFINHRLRLYKLDMEIPISKSIDIYRILRQNRPFIDIDDLKLTTVEEYLGIYREDIYTGKDCIAFYKDYILTLDKVLKERILKHNYDDLYYLLPVAEIVNIIRFQKTIEVRQGEKTLPLILESIKIINDYFEVEALVNSKGFEEFTYYGENYSLSLDRAGDFKLNFEVRRGLVTDEKEAIFIISKEFNIDTLDIDKLGYDIPSNIVLLAVEKDFAVGNVKKFIERFISSILA